MGSQKSGDGSGGCLFSLVFTLAILLGFPALYFFAKSQETKQAFNLDSGTLPSDLFVCSAAGCREDWIKSPNEEFINFDDFYQDVASKKAEQFCLSQGFDRHTYWTSRRANDAKNNQNPGISNRNHFLTSVVCLNSPFP